MAELLRPGPRPPRRRRTGGDDLRELPGGVANTTHGEGVRRGVGYGIGIKNVGFSEGFDDYSTARVRLELVGGEPAALVHTAAAEVGQGLVTVQAQIARTELGVEQVTVATADTTVGSAGSTLGVAADLRHRRRRPGRLRGGPRAACCARVRAADDVQLVDGRGRRPPAARSSRTWSSVLGDGPIEETVEWRHRPTHPLDPVTGQGDAHVQYAFAAHRATVDVDIELGLVRVVEIATAQDVGRALNPQAVLGQIHGGTAQGLGLALMEEIQVVDGRDPQPVVHRLPDPHHPRHAADARRRAGARPTRTRRTACAGWASRRPSRPRRRSSPRSGPRPACALTRVPVRPEHLTGT